MPEKKRTDKTKQTWKNKKVILIGTVLIAIIVVSVTTYIVTKPKKETPQQTTVNSNTQEQTEKQVETPKTPEAPKEPEKKPEPEKPVPNPDPNLPEISKESPKLTREKIEKIKLEMTEEEVKAIIGNDVYEAAKKAGQNLGSVTLNLSDNKGGIVLGFDQGKLISLTRTYSLKANTSNSFTNITKGMTKEAVIAQLGLPTAEMGKQGTIVYSYQYQTNQGTQTKVIIFDIDDKVMLVQ